MKKDVSLVGLSSDAAYTVEVKPYHNGVQFAGYSGEIMVAGKSWLIVYGLTKQNAIDKAIAQLNSHLNYEASLAAEPEVVDITDKVVGW